jgi:hypothetical protein
MGTLLGCAPMTDDTVNISQARLELAKLRQKRRLAVWNSWLRGMGWITRPVVYLGPMAFLVWWLWPYVDLLSQSLDSLTPIDFLLIGGCIVGFFGVAIPAMLFVFNVDRADIDWEAWGCVGFGLLAALVPLWATFWVGLH